MLETRDIPNVEILKIGRWHGTGCPPRGCEFTAEDLDEIATAYAATAEVLRPPVKLGHTDQQKLLQADGLPAAGWLSNIRRDGEKLLADLRAVPKRIADLIDVGAYRNRSIELNDDFEVGGKKYPLVATGLALLGVDIPAVETLADITALYASRALSLPEEGRAVMFTAEATPEQESGRRMLTYVDNAEHVLTDVQAFLQRTEELAALRANEGRSFAYEKHRDRLASLRDGLREAHTRLDAFLAEREPEPTQDYSRVMRARLRAAELRRAELVGVTT